MGMGVVEDRSGGLLREERPWFLPKPTTGEHPNRESSGPNLPPQGGAFHLRHGWIGKGCGGPQGV